MAVGTSCPEQRSVGVVSDHLLFPTTVGERRLGLWVWGAREARAAAQAWLDRMGLADGAGARSARCPAGRPSGRRPRAAVEPRSAARRAARRSRRRHAVRVRADLRRHLAAFPAACSSPTTPDAIVLADRLVIRAHRVTETARRPR